MGDRVIKDIRYYGSNVENIYVFPKEIYFIGQRIARKLNENKFVSGVFDHLYINYTTCLEDGKILISTREIDDRIQYIDYGLSPSKINSLRVEEKLEFIKESTFKTLELIFARDNEKARIISEVKHEIDNKGSELEIFFKSKETKKYKIVLTYQIRPNGNKSCMLIEFIDKAQNISIKLKVTDLFIWDDIYYIVDSITVKEDLIIIKPKTSSLAKCYYEKYITPITLNISKLGLM